MRKHSTALLAFSIMVAAAPAAFADQQKKAAPKITTDALGGGFYRLVGPGGNIGVLIGDDGAFVIDDKFDRFGDQIKAQIKAITDKPIRYVVNTHYHGDHTGANGSMKESGATIVAHDNVRTRMGLTFENKLWKNTVKATKPHQWPTVTYSENATYHMNGQTIKLIHTPSAHTDGDTIIYFAEGNVLHMGDNFFHGLFPYVDVDGGGSLQGMIAAQTTAINMINGDTRVIPGHGDMATKDDLIESRDMLKDIKQRVKAAIKDGQSLDEIIAAKPLADLAHLASFIDEEKMIRIAHRSLSE